MLLYQDARWREFVKQIEDQIRALQADHALLIRTSAQGAALDGASLAAAQLREALATLTDEGIVLRDPYRGLIDFPARTAAGREYHLCWLLGEPNIAWWHWPEAGFAGRTPIEEAPA